MSDQPQKSQSHAHSILSGFLKWVEMHRFHARNPADARNPGCIVNKIKVVKDIPCKR